MSQVSFKTQYMGFAVEIVAGWDEPLQYYHLTVFDNRADAEEEYIFSCLDTPNPFAAKTTERWKAKLIEMNIKIPDGFWERVEKKEADDIYSFK